MKADELRKAIEVIAAVTEADLTALFPSNPRDKINHKFKLLKRQPLDYLLHIDVYNLGRLAKLPVEEPTPEPEPVEPEPVAAKKEKPSLKKRLLKK
jgi:hypothetical protein